MKKKIDQEISFGITYHIMNIENLFVKHSHNHLLKPNSKKISHGCTINIEHIIKSHNTTIIANKNVPENANMCKCIIKNVCYRETDI